LIWQDIRKIDRSESQFNPARAGVKFAGQEGGKAQRAPAQPGKGTDSEKRSSDNSSAVVIDQLLTNWYLRFTGKIGGGQEGTRNPTTHLTRTGSKGERSYIRRYQYQSGND
jgi:hypothetical protein